MEGNNASMKDKLKQFCRAATYQFFRALTGVIAILWLRVRWNGAHNIPAEGSLIILSNHQSNADPVFIAAGSRRPLCYFARKTLFVGPFGWLIRILDAIPIDRDGGGIAGLKETLKRLKAGKGIVIFPEGTRTTDGNLGKLKSGFCILAKRGKASLLPMGIAGAYEAFPRGRIIPKFGHVSVQFGEVIPYSEVKEMDEKALVQLVTERIESCRQQAKLALER